MATTRTKSVGNILGQSRDYWVNAAKQFVWPIDFEQVAILIPEKDLPIAADDLMVKHFRSNGWHIQSAIEVEYTKPFTKPVSTGKPIFYQKHVEEKAASKYTLGKKFRIRSSDCELEITHIEHGKIHLHYTNRPHKADLLTSEEHLDKAVRNEYWEVIL